MPEKAPEQSSYVLNEDMLLLQDGSTYHLGVKEGEIFPRILTVGAKKRAQAIATLFDKNKPIKVVSSNREFLTLSGYYRGVGVSIIAIGMGAPMMDFMIREASYVQPKPMAIIRLGTCGLLNENIATGVAMTAGKGSMYINTNYDHFAKLTNGSKIGEDSTPFHISQPIHGDARLNDALVHTLNEAGVTTYNGLNASAETFYYCQGRHDSRFNDGDCREIMGAFRSSGVDFVEMEVHQLFHLASIRRIPCYAAAVAIGVVNRLTGTTITSKSGETLEDLEKKAGACCLDALVNFTF